MYGVVDCNNFYVSCERVFQPSLEKVPVVVLSNNDGCIISRSQEVRDLDVRMGDPAFKYRELFARNNVRVFSANFPLYADLSSRVMKTISEFVPDMEMYSIDEAFYKYTAIDLNFHLTQAEKIRKAVMKGVGIPVSIGIASTKTLSKVANEAAKKNPRYKGVCSLFTEKDRDKILEYLDVGDIWGIGRQLRKFLHERGIFTAYQLMHCDDAWIKKELTISGLKTVKELRGEECIEVEFDRPAKKSIISSKSFGYKVTRLEDLVEAVSSFTARAAEKLREENEVVGCIHVAITTSYYKKEELRYSNIASSGLPWPTNYTPTLIEAAVSALKRIFKPGILYKKATVMFTGLTDVNTVQASLFHPVRSSKEEANLMKAVDSINRLWGSGTVQFASQGIQKKWKGKSENRSKRYTTNWAELPVVKS
jgi:DNA polymerase V